MRALEFDSVCVCILEFDSLRECGAWLQGCSLTPRLSERDVGRAYNTCKPTCKPTWKPDGFNGHVVYDSSDSEGDVQDSSDSEGDVLMRPPMQQNNGECAHCARHWVGWQCRYCSWTATSWNAGRTGSSQYVLTTFAATAHSCVLRGVWPLD